MARRLFGPDLVFRPAGQKGAAIKSAATEPVTIYVDDGSEPLGEVPPESAVLADVLSFPAAEPLEDSTVTVGSDEMYPRFWGTDDLADSLIVNVDGFWTRIFSRTDASDVAAALSAETAARAAADTAEATARANADAAEAAARAAADAALSSDIAAVAVAGAEAVAEVADDLDAETARATGAEAGLASDIADETTRATNAEAARPTSAALAAQGGAALVGFAPTGTIAATTVQAAVAEVASDAAAAYVPILGAAQAAGSFLPVFTRDTVTTGGGLAGKVGFQTGATLFNSRPDPLVSIGFYGATAAEGAYALQLEADWDVGANGRIAETYLQTIQRVTGASRRDFYSLRNTVDNLAIATYVLVGNGRNDTGQRPGGFFVNWDDDTSQVGVSMFSAKANRLNLYAVTTGGITAQQTRLCLFSNSTGSTSTDKGSAIALTWGGNDAEGSANPTYLLQTTNTGVAIQYSRGLQVMQFSNNGSAGAIGFLGAGAAVRQVVTGSKATGAALTSLLTAMATFGFITDSTSA